MPFRDSYLAGANGGYLSCASTVLADAFSGAGTKAATTANSSANQVGGKLVGSTYTIYQQYAEWDTSGIPDTAIIDDAAVWFFSSNSEGVEPGLVQEAYAYDWGGSTLTTDDWVDPRTLTGRCAYHAEDSRLQNTDYGFTTDSSFVAAVNKTGYTRLVLTIAANVAGSAPGAEDIVNNHGGATPSDANKPCLVVTWHLPDEDTEGAHNYVVNPRLRTDASGWTASTGGIAFTRQTAPDVGSLATLPRGQNILRVTTTATTGTDYVASDEQWADAGDDWKLAADYYWPGASGCTPSLRVLWYNHRKVVITSGGDTLAHNSFFQPVAVTTQTAPAGTYYVAACIYRSSSGSGTWAAGSTSMQLANWRLDLASTFTEVDDAQSYGYQKAGNIYDGYIDSYDIGSPASYDEARAGTGSGHQVSAGDTSYTGIGQAALSGEYDIFESFLNFTMSALPDACTPTAVDLWLYTTAGTEEQAFTIEARYHPWLSNTTLAWGDWVAGANLASKPILGSVSSADWLVGGWVKLPYDDTDDGAGNVDPTGYLQVLLHSSRQRTNDAPSIGTAERVGFRYADYTGTSTDPQAVITFTIDDVYGYRDGESGGLWMWAGSDDASISYEQAMEWSTASVIINAGAASTDDNDVTLTLSAAATMAGAAQTITHMAFSDDGDTWGSWVAYATSYPYQLPAQTTYPTVTRTVYAKFRFSYLGTYYESGEASDSISLGVTWQVDIEINGGADWTDDRDVELVLHGESSAADTLYSVPDEYRLRENGGTWGSWTDYVMNGGKRHGRHYCVVEYTLGGAGSRSVEVQFRDDDSNTSPLDADSIQYIASVVPGSRYDGGPPPYDASHWRLVVGSGTVDLMPYLAAPPKFGHGRHGDAYLEATIVVDDPARRFLNELVAQAPVALWDQQHRLWSGWLKPVERVSEGEPAITIQATGDLDQAKQDEGFVKTWVDTDPTRWFQDTKDSRAYNVDTEGRLRLEHEKGRGVTADKGCALRYWLDDGLRTTDVIDHVVFTGYDINVNAAAWYARLSTCDNPWTGHTAYKTWNDEAVSGLGSLRYPTSGSFADDGVSGVYGLKLRLWSDSDITAAGSANDRYAIFDDVAVYVSSAAPTVDEAMGDVAVDMGWTTDLTTVGSAIADLRISELGTRAAALDALAELYSGELEWYVSNGLFVCREQPTAPEQRHHWYVVDTRNCSFNVVGDSEMRVDYVAVVYAIKGSGTYPNGTRRILWRPSAPASESDRCTVLDIQELGLKTTAQAEAAGDQYLAWNAANSISGDIAGFGALLKTVDGVWVPACHARPGDWVQPVDRLDMGPLYITGVQVDAFDQVTLSTGGSEGEFRGVPRTRTRRPKFWRRKLHWRVEHDKPFI